MKISMIGCGKLGFPVAMAWALKHDVVGYDLSPHAKDILSRRIYPHVEKGAQELLETTDLKVVDTIDKAVAHGDIIFIAVQTPHGAEYEGITVMPDTRADFDYKALKSSVAQVALSAKEQRKSCLMVVISTVLPGTSERELYPIIEGNPYVSLVYSPMFIAMGTTIDDALNPEMVLIGTERKNSGKVLEIMTEFYRPLHKSTLVPMSIKSAELSKVAYNVFLGLKIVAANTVMEIAHKTGADCDEVTTALSLATERVVSSKYMRGGMGDGGACHPRDMIALSWLAQRLDLSYDLFGSMVKAREQQTQWLADLAYVESAEKDLSVVILGKAYKKGTNLTTGSPAILLRTLMESDGFHRVEHWDPHIDPPRVFDKPAIFFIGTNHLEFFAMNFPEGSTIIDPWGQVPDKEGCKVIRIGRN